MRDLADSEHIHLFMRELGLASRKPAKIYFAGGVSAVLMGFRKTTVDLDIKLIADDDSLLRELPRLKEELRINVELATPDQFIPPLPGWAERSRLIASEGRVSFYHYDFYAQALAKIRRGHRLDMEDAGAMLREGLIEPARLTELFGKIEPELYRYPAIDPKTFKAALGRFLA